MTTHTVFPTPLPQDGEPDGKPDAGLAGCEPEEVPQAPPPLTIHEVYTLLREHRAAVHEALQEHRAAGGVVAVPFDAVFLCELAGLVLDLETGAITGCAAERVAPVMALRERLAELFGPLTVDSVATAA